MRWGLLQNRLTIAFVAFGAGLVASFIAEPLYKRSLEYFWHEKFAQLTFECDQSMRLHLLAKQKVAENVSEINIDGLKSAEIGLLDCQDYDLFQKKMKRWGLSDNEIAEMVLLAAEEQNNSLRKVIQIHEINYSD